MIDILTYLPAKRKQSSSGWVSFNAPCCEHNGESRDRRQRGGMKATDQGWSYHCFNCGYTSSFTLGRPLSFKARKLLQWLNVDSGEIERINLESLRHRSVEGLIESRKVVEILSGIDFEPRELPAHCELLTPDQTYYWNYVRSRAVPEDYPIMTQPTNDGVHWTRMHVVVPFTHNHEIVGFSARFLDGKIPKYINDTQPGYVFGTDLQQANWNHAIVVEGVFDALCINGLAVLHNDINDAQVRLIRSLDKQITVVPDQDKAGLALVDRAQELGWAVSIPPWPADVKDVNDAVIKYGRTATLLSIFENRVQGKIKIDMARRHLRSKIGE